ncbi:MAG: aspartate-semialdehyde dehydrogenase [Clostridia bacterium]|nr:aspartate-semialdehyde dehydrogenase [Clostridia bacterium]MDN5323272.1 aspartate-semialdehyde dehydrogenase [Clostridia bacterium]
MKKLNVAIVGATGAVGQEILKVMSEKKFPYKNLKLLASQRSAGTEIEYQGKKYLVEETTENSFDGIDLALFAGGPASRAFGRFAQQKGVVVIDNSSTFRLEPDVPLVVPEVNAEALKNHQGLIANPNCSTIIMVAALYPLYKFSKIKRIIVSTYQAVSGAGKEGIEELELQVKQNLEGNKVEPKVFPYQIAYNLIPHIDVWVEENYTKEEMKMVYETQKILNDYELAVTATTVRVPVYRSHSESIYIETEEPISLEKARELLCNSKGIILQDNPSQNLYPMPLYTSDTDEVYVGRIRKDLYTPNGLNLWVVADQIRKGAATNAVQIAEELLKNNLI